MIQTFSQFFLAVRMRHEHLMNWQRRKGEGEETQKAELIKLWPIRNIYVAIKWKICFWSWFYCILPEDHFTCLFPCPGKIWKQWFLLVVKPAHSTLHSKSYIFWCTRCWQDLLLVNIWWRSELCIKHYSLFSAVLSVPQNTIVHCAVNT